MHEEQFDNYRDHEVIFLHILLFVYRGAIEKILATGALIFESPTFEAMMKILEEENLISVQGDTLGEALENHLRKLQDSGLVKEARFERLSSHRYMLHIDKCVYAKRLHQCLKPFLNGQICVHAITTLPVFQKFCKKAVKINPSNFSEEGTKTTIEL